MSIREAPISLTVSLIIPCHVKHVKYLPNLIKEYIYNQTVLVDEIVISLSDVNYIERFYPEILMTLKKSWPIPVILIENKDQVSEGDNRNRACRKAVGDIFICQDADDIPHRQRVELIKYMFENYNVDHLIHKYFISFDVSLLDQYFDKTSLDWFAPTEYDINNGANGVASISRRVFEAIQWYPGFSHGVDVEFNMKAYSLFENRIVVNDPIYLYRERYQGDDSAL